MKKSNQLFIKIWLHQKGIGGERWAQLCSWLTHGGGLVVDPCLFFRLALLLEWNEQRTTEISNRRHQHLEERCPAGTPQTPASSLRACPQRAKTWVSGLHGLLLKRGNRDAGKIVRFLDEKDYRYRWRQLSLPYGISKPQPADISWLMLCVAVTA